MKTGLFTFCLILVASLVNAQQWVKDMRNPNVNFFVVQKEFNLWWQEHKTEILAEGPEEEENEHSEYGEMWKIYKRWEHQMLPDMIRTGGVRNAPFDSTAYMLDNAPQEKAGAANWVHIGPPQSFNFYGNSIGRLNSIRFSPNSPDTMFVCAPNGGLWKSNDAGLTWQLLNTDNLGQIGVTDVAIDPTNSQIIYIATGDFAINVSNSIGIKKSVDGGQTWSNTGLTWTVSQNRTISRLLINPSNPSILLASANNGIYRSTDAGATWTLKLSATDMRSMEFMPGNPNTVFACNDGMYKSTNGGSTWVTVSSGLPTGTGQTMAIAVTPANSNYVFVAVADQSGPFDGLYRSTNGGVAFSQVSSPGNITGESYGGYSFCIGVSAINKDLIVVAGMDCAYSSDGGLSWDAPTSDLHPDHHNIVFHPTDASKVYSVNDGGIFVSTDAGANWTGLNDGLKIGEIYHTSSGHQSPYLNLTGRQDMGTVLRDGNTFQSVFEGDGMSCIIDPVDENTMYFAYQYGGIVREDQNGLEYICDYSGSGVQGIGQWLTPYILGPQNHSSLYVAKDYIYKSIDGGFNWEQLNSPYAEYPYSYDVLVIAPSDSNYIYASSYDGIYRSVDGGANFTNIANGVLSGSFINAIGVDEHNPQLIWVSYSVLGNAGLVKSVNGGNTYTNYATGLLSTQTVKCIVEAKDSPQALYIGTQNYGGGSVYYRDSTMSSWMLYNTNLPNVAVYDIEISYPAGKVRAATHGRDLWESDLYATSYYKPTAAITSVTTICVGGTVQFTDASAHAPNAWSWTFDGGNPPSSTVQNPVVTYNTAGIYNVQLIATNDIGSDTVLYNNYITVNICNSIDESALANSIIVKPNPTGGDITLQFESPENGNVKLMLIDASGKKVFDGMAKKETKQFNYSFDATGISSGIYLLSISFNNKQYSKRVFIK